MYQFTFNFNTKLFFQIPFTIIIFLSSSFAVKDDQTNEVVAKTSTLDTNLRKALLKALTELENEERQSSSHRYKHLDLYPDKSIESATASSLTLYSQNIDEVPSTTSTERSVVVIQKSSAVQHKPITIFLSTQGYNETDGFITSASSSINVSDSKKIYPSSSINSYDNLEKFTLQDARTISAKAGPSSPSPTAPTPTTEESEANVEDIQFFSAPLLAAFTVHQDERGLPKSVEPIFKQSTQVPVTTTLAGEHQRKQKDVYSQELLKMEKARSQISFQSKQVDEHEKKQEESYTQEFLKREQLRTQIALQEKQKLLEEQLFKIQLQQKQQEELILKQQYFLQQQQQKLLNERQHFQNLDFVSITTPSPHLGTSNQQHNFPDSNQLKSQNLDIPNKNKGSVVSFQSSVMLNPPDELNKAPTSLNRELQGRNTADYYQRPFTAVSTPSKIEPVLIPSYPFTYPNINYAQNIGVPLTNQNRIFRREPLTGNFINEVSKPGRFFNSVSIQPSVQIPPRPLRSNVENYQVAPGTPNHQPIINQHLKNLLYQSGISTGKPSEDFSIISKVLSYNHVGGESFFDPRQYHKISRSGKVVR